jgi:hypothetical protein
MFFIKQLSVKGWVATVLMFSCLFMMWYTYGKADLWDTFSIFAFFGLLGVIFDDYNKDNPLIYIGPNRDKKE